MGVTLGTVGALFGIMAATHVISPSAIEVVTFILGSQLLAWAGFATVYVSQVSKAQARNPNFKLYKEVRPITMQLQQSLVRRRLHRDLSSSTATVLEEGARQWSRVQNALKSPFWQDSNLPEHWRALRDQASQNAERAMLELILLLQSGFRPNTGGRNWESVVVDVVEQLGGKVTVNRDDEMVPITYQQARELLVVLSELADEIESSTRDLSEVSSMTDDRMRARLAMNQTVQELKAIREAEEELRQSQGR